MSTTSELVTKTVALIHALRERDDNTGGHSDRTCALSVELGKVCGLSEAELDMLRLAAQLHDLGKIGIRDNVLLKPGRLDDDELQTMRTHAQRGHDILIAIPDPQVASIAVVVRHHHEAFDGNGYPSGLRGEEIPIMSRIVAVADSYDAMATVRPYHKPRTHAEIMWMMFEQLAGKYDPWLEQRFARIVVHSPYRATT
jgi:HD-GYP domain-containing protein (c-di-GMP phosphodiesterase class II)